MAIGGAGWSRVIPKVSRGWKIGGLIRYLMGPGRDLGPDQTNDHTDQRVVASWDGNPGAHQPPRRTSAGYGEFDVEGLVDELLAPAFAGGVSMTKPAVAGEGKAPAGPVWHCSLRNHADDRVLTDAEWAQVVAEVMDATGIAPHGDEGGCRWVAVRHAEDHVHIAAVLVRQDSLRRFYPFRDWPAVRAVARAAEQRWGLTPTAATDRTAVTPPSRAETEKAARRGLEETPRELLRRCAKLAAVAARDPQSYFEELKRLGVDVAPRRSGAGRLLGYAVSRHGDLNADGRPVWFSGSTLSPDLSLPKLQDRWASAPAPPPPIPPTPAEHSQVGARETEAAVAEAVSAMEHAAASLAAGEDSGEAAGIVHAVEDMIGAVSAVTAPILAPLSPRDGPAQAYQRAARQAGVGQPTSWGPVAAQLRSAAWRLIAVRTLAGRGGGGAAALMLALASLLAEVAAYHDTRQHLAQARAARTTRVLVGARRPPGRPAAPGGPPGRATETTRTRTTGAAAEQGPAIPVTRPSPRPRPAPPPRPHTPPRPRRRR